MFYTVLFVRRMTQRVTGITGIKVILADFTNKVSNTYKQGIYYSDQMWPKSIFMCCCNLYITRYKDAFLLTMDAKSASDLPDLPV